MITRIYRLGLMGVAAALLLAGAVPAAASGPTVTGAGSTWVQIALDQWRADIARQGYNINFQGVGSSAGRQFFIINQVDFAASEIPFQPEELPSLAGKSYQYVPDVAGGTSLMYNLHTPTGARIRNLRLTAGTAAGIFTGSITSWHDGQIQALNPGLQIRETDIKPVIRSDGSGTSAQFSLYLADQASATWAAFVRANGCPAPCSLWPYFGNSSQQRGSDGVAGFVANDQLGSGSIGYVEAGYAFGRGFPVASLRNASGNFVQPTSGNVAIALTHARLHADLTQDLTNVYRAPEASAYPMSSYSYLITRTTGFDPAKGYVLGTWMIYIACAGQREAPLLGYSPLPPNLVGFVFDAVRRIPGAPTPPPIDRQHCPNPTVGTAAAGPTVSATSSTSAAAGGTAAASASASSAAAGTSASASASNGTAASGTTAGGSNQNAVLEAQAAIDQASGGGGGSVAGVMVTTLDDKQRHASYALAQQLASSASVPPDRTLLLVASLLVLLVFAPILFEFRRHERRPGAQGGDHVD
jgi:phosphate ABC transporter phosphate-binding protein